MNIYLYLYVFIYIYIYAYIYICVFIYIYTCAYIHICTSMSLHIHRSHPSLPVEPVELSAPHGRRPVDGRRSRLNTSGDLSTGAGKAGSRNGSRGPAGHPLIIDMNIYIYHYISYITKNPIFIDPIFHLRAFYRGEVFDEKGFSGF